MPAFNKNSNSESRVGSTLADGKYVLESFIGRGGMGALYRARHTILDRFVAIKLLHPDWTDHPTAEARFLIEAKAASRLDHPCSIQILDFGSEQGTCYIVMELLEGRDLATVLEKEGALDPLRAVSIMSQVLAAVAAAHDEGILHRDIKPENIMVLRQRDETDGQERVKVLDFGIAKIGSSEGSVSRALTAVGEVCGTPEYMSPEQARGLTLDARTDLYSCGVVLFRILTKKLPFLGENPIGTLMQHITEPVPRPSTIRPNLPPMLDDVIVKAMAKQPADRFPDARTMRSALLDAIGAERGSSMPEIAFASRSFRPSVPSPSIAQLERAPTMSVAPSSPGSRRWLAIVLVLTASVVISMALMWMRMSAPEQAPHTDFSAEDSPDLSTTHLGLSKSEKPQKGTKSTAVTPDELLEDEPAPVGQKNKKQKKDRANSQPPDTGEDVNDIEEVLEKDPPADPKPPLPQEDTDTSFLPPDGHEVILEEESPLPI